MKELRLEHSGKTSLADTRTYRPIDVLPAILIEGIFYPKTCKMGGGRFLVPHIEDAIAVRTRTV